MLGFAASFIVLLLALPCRADDFCEGLKSEAKTAGSDFDSIRGQPDADDPTLFSNPFMLPGTNRFLTNVPPCSVDRLSKDSAIYQYSCTFSASAMDIEAKDQLAAFTAHVASCLGIAAPDFDFTAPHERNVFASSNRGPFHLSSNGVNIETGLFFPPDGGGGTLYVNVARAK
jgi:hypothetical protein